MAWLSALTVGQAQAAFDAFREEVSATLPQDSQDVIGGAARAMSANIVAGTPYGHPLHWAPYMLIGR
jgi:hypothetical protein